MEGIMEKISREEWERKVALWQASGKSAKAWSQEQGVNYNSFLSAKKRILKKPVANFLELEQEQNLGLEVSFKGIKFILSRNFDEKILLRFVKILGAL